MSEGLLPSIAPTQRVRVDRELPIEARTWGRVINFDALEAGDLLLFRPADVSIADRISRWIVNAQTAGGFALRHARWTHAAVYLGEPSLNWTEIE